MFWLLVCVITAILVYHYLIKPFSYWNSIGVQQYPIWKIWLEFLLGIVQYRPFADTIKKTYDAYPSARYCGDYQFYTPALMVRDPDLIKQIAVRDFDHFTDHFNFFPSGEVSLWERNLFFLKGEKWREMRNHLTPSFTGTKIKTMFGLANECAKQFVKYFEEQGGHVIQVEMKDTFTRFTNDVIATTTFGITCDSIRDPDNEFYLMGKEATHSGGGMIDMIKFLFISALPKLSRAVGLKMFKNDTGTYFGNVIKSNIKSREQNGIVRPDMIHLLLEARKGRSGEENKIITDEDIVAQAFVFFLAGFNSVAALMYFLAYELAVQPDVQEKLQEEIDSIVNSLDDALTYEKLSGMKYMDTVMSETLRKWPATVVLDRVCVKPYTIQPVMEGEKPVYLKKGDLINFPLYGLHRDPEYYPAPNRFDPERFSDENKSNINPYANLAFGVGPRSCIGRRLALLETKVVFFHLLSKFDIVVTERTPIPLLLSKSKLLLDNDEGFWMGLKLRKATP